MNPSGLFIRRPVATTLLTIAIAIAGAIAFTVLPVSPLPQVDFPTISVSATMAGASPETMATSVAAAVKTLTAAKLAGSMSCCPSASRHSTELAANASIASAVNPMVRTVLTRCSSSRRMLNGFSLQHRLM